VAVAAAQLFNMLVRAMLVLSPGLMITVKAAVAVAA
jgi:hypothetical protein